ncbi:hypothetical protein [Meiothermus cerbereus]|uniref:hypothetical protein n=1 Tax=Meiothermus cerbereus TaxID=65552 RepID=UPI003EEA9BA7
MPKTLNPQNAFPPNIPNFPISGNNEPIAIEPLENAVQAVLNRTENLHVRLSEAETQGVKRVRTVASLAALSAATGFVNGDVCDVEGYGRYRLYNPSSLPADGLWVLTASGGGRWVHTLRDMRGIGNGLATLDSGGRLAQDVRDASILTQHIGNSQVTAAKIADGAVNLAKLSSGILGTANGLATLNSSGRLAQDVRDASILTQHIGNSQVTSAKLAPGAVVGHLGYTPLNRAGDTMSGSLNINTQILQTFMLPGQPNQMNIIWPTATDSSRFIFVPSPSGVPDYSREFSYNFATGHWEVDETLSANQIVAQDIQGRYNHTNRFTVSAFAGQDISVGGNDFVVVGRTFVTVPSGRSLFIRRVRAYATGHFRIRVAAIPAGLWVAGQAQVDADINQSILTGPSSELVYIGADNISGSAGTLFRGHGAMVELEIR